MISEAVIILLLFSKQSCKYLSNQQKFEQNSDLVKVYASQVVISVIAIFFSKL